jgi:hypothetical protein
MIPKHIKLAQKTNDLFRSENADVLCCAGLPLDDVMQITTDSASLDEKLCADLKGAIVLLAKDQTGLPLGQSVADKYFMGLLYNGLAKAFINAMNSEVIPWGMKLTDRADEQFCELRYRCGMERRPEVAPVLSPAEALDAEIQHDWIHLPTDKLNAKKRTSPGYAKRLNELLESDAIKSQATTLHDGAKL